jgi:hypothetical protein
MSVVVHFLIEDAHRQGYVLAAETMLKREDRF